MVCAPFCPISVIESATDPRGFSHRPCLAHAAHESIFVLDALVHKTVGSEFQGLAESDFRALRRR